MKNTQKKEKTVAGRIGSLFASIALVLALMLLILSIYTMVQAKNDPKNAFLFGYKPVVVETSSMSPYILQNSVVVIHKTDFTQVKAGDVVTYETNGQFVTHRAVSMANNQITVRGDNNSAPDTQRVTPRNFVGSAAYRMNWVEPVISGFKQNPASAAARYLALPLAFLILLYFIILMVVKFVRTGKEGK